MKKKIIFLFIIGILLAGCNIQTEENVTIPTENESSIENEDYKEFNDFNIKEFVANITDANGLGIKHQKSNTKNKKKNTTSGGENVLVKTTTEYGEGDVVVSEGKIEEVTFTKIDTEVKSEKITGEVTYTANQKEGSISFKAYDGFEYTIIHDNTTLFSNIKDNDVNDADEIEGIIKIEGLKKGKSYKVTYVGYGEETTITQSDVNAEIDKVCVLDGRFTFTSFVPKGLSNRPYGESLTLDQDGVAIYDKIDYISSNTRKNFVLDNYSGLIYDLKNVNISKVDCNLVVINGEYCELSTDDTGNLLFTEICKNKTLNVRYAFKDKYGNKYILNDKLETYDSNTSTYYYVTGSAIYENHDINCSVKPEKRYCYFRTSTNEAIRLPVLFAYAHEMENEFKTVDVILENGNYREINENDSFDLYPYNDGAYFIYEPKNVINGVVRIIADYSGIITQNSFRQYVGDEGFYYLQNQNHQVKCYTLFAQCMQAVNPYFVDDYDVMFIVFDGIVYSFQNCFEYALMMEKIQNDSRIWLGNEQIEFEVDNKYIKILIEDIIIENGKLIKYGVDGNQSFDVYVEGNKDNPEIFIYETGTYTPSEPSTNAIVIQPINR